MTQENYMLDMAARFSDAVNSRDMDSLANLLDDKVVVWHNVDRKEQTKQEALAGIREFNASVHASRYTDIRRRATCDGFVQQHDLELQFEEGGPLTSLAVCLVITLSQGRIVRLDEYLDCSGFAQS